MSHENIQINQPNICLGPQVGTLCTIDTTNPQTVLKVKNFGGGTVIDLTLSSNILNENIRLEYVGPSTLTTMVDDLIFFTFERVDDTTCMIKRWQTRMAYSELLLKEQIIKKSSGPLSFNSIDFAVEYNHRSFQDGNEYYNYLFMEDVSNIKTGTRLFLGPSTDTDNLEATEQAIVTHVSIISGKNKVWLTGPLKNQYVRGDMVTFYSHVYVYSKENSPGDDSLGSLIKLDAYTWQQISKDSKAWYKRVTASRWCPSVRGIASVVGTNMLFVRPYDSYQNWKSMFLRNVKDDKNTIFDVYDVVFDNSIVYKLQKFTTLRDDDGGIQTITWDYYNYQEDTLSPYSSSVALWTESSIQTGHLKDVALNAQVRDQFHVGLRDVITWFSKDPDGDPQAIIWPYSGLATTDKDGLSSVTYKTGTEYFGHTQVAVRATGSTNATGSEYVWALHNIINYPNFPELYILITTFSLIWDFGHMRQITPNFEVMRLENPTDIVLKSLPPLRTVFCKSFFTSIGGDWGNDDNSPTGEKFFSPEYVKEWLIELYQGDDKQTDGPANYFSGYGFNPWPWQMPAGGKFFVIANSYRLVDSFESNNSIESLTEFFLYHGKRPPDCPLYVISWPPYIYIKQPDETGHLQISQLKLSLHTHWVDGEPQDELTTYVNVDQFIFVEDAIPKFWSEKNPIETDIWVRLRPFAFSLDNATLRIWIKVASSQGNTGYKEITGNVELTNFDAGGGLLGIEVFYNPPEDFPHGSLIFIKIEVYDQAYIPNFILVEYWFYITPDYKAPYLTNLSPSREEINVPIDSNIYFEIKDIGAGIDMDSLEFLLNSRRMQHDSLNIEIISAGHIKVTYVPPSELYYSMNYKITAKAVDLSPQSNIMNDAYIFYTVDSTGTFITDPSPGVCKRGMKRFEDVSAVVLADGNGVDRHTIRMQVFNKDVQPKIIPIVYRVG